MCGFHLQSMTDDDDEKKDNFLKMAELNKRL